MMEPWGETPTENKHPRASPANMPPEAAPMLDFGNPGAGITCQPAQLLNSTLGNQVASAGNTATTSSVNSCMATNGATPRYMWP